MSNSQAETTRDNAVALIARGKKLYLNNSSAKNKYKGYQEMKAGCYDLLEYIRQEPSEDIKIITKQVLKGYIDELETMNKILGLSNVTTNLTQEESVNQQQTELEYTQSYNEDNFSQQLISLRSLGSFLQIEKLNATSHHVIGLEAAVLKLKESIILPFKFPELFVGSRRAENKILLYGPPGTGKTELIKACGAECNAVMCTFQIDELIPLSKEKAVEILELINSVRQEKQIIFLLKNIERCSSFAELNAVFKTLNLNLLLQDTKCLVFFVAMTKYPWKLDHSLRKGFPLRIEVGLLDKQKRFQFITDRMRKQPNTFTNDQLYELAVLAEGFNGPDMENLIYLASLEPNKKIEKATFFQEVETKQGKKYLPCSMCDPDAEQYEKEKMAQDILIPQLEFDDFINVLPNIKATVTEQELKLYREWNQEYC